MLLLLLFFVLQILHVPKVEYLWSWSENFDYYTWSLYALRERFCKDSSKKN